MGFDNTISSTASAHIYEHGRSKKQTEHKYIDALWHAHTKHERVASLSELKEVVGYKGVYKLQPEQGKIVIRTVSDYLAHMKSKKKLLFLDEEQTELCMDIAKKVDEDDGLPCLIPDVAVAILRRVILEHKIKIQKGELCKMFDRSVAPVSQATKYLEKKLG